MPRTWLPAPSMILEPMHARRFLLSHQRLLPPRRLAGKAGILELFEHLGCIQYDPIDIVGRNPDLVLQSRMARYRPSLLDRLMHAEHKVYVGWDKMSALVLRDTWPSFARHRALMGKQHGDPETPEMKVAPLILDEIRRRGPLSSRDIDHAGKVDWWWGRPTRVVHASLEILCSMGVVLPHHRERSVRYFDLAERVFPAEILGAPDPHPDDMSYEDWHVLRRVGSLGLAPANGAPEYWWGIMGVKGGEARAKVLARLAERGDVVPVAVDGVAKRTFFIRASDVPTVEATAAPDARPPEAAFLAPLDNVTWDRELLRQVFDFDYCWEIYKPKEKRSYGYYVLPVLYGERFIARVEPTFDKKAHILSIGGWWWEPGVRQDAGTASALRDALSAFAAYLGADDVHLGDSLASNRTLRRALGIPAKRRTAAR